MLKKIIMILPPFLFRRLHLWSPDHPSFQRQSLPPPLALPSPSFVCSVLHLDLFCPSAQLRNKINCKTKILETDGGLKNVLTQVPCGSLVFDMECVEFVEESSFQIFVLVLDILNAAEQEHLGVGRNRYIHARSQGWSHADLFHRLPSPFCQGCVVLWKEKIAGF